MRSRLSSGQGDGEWSKERPVYSCQETYGERKRAPERAFVRALPREGLGLSRCCLVIAVEDLPRIVHCLQDHIETRPPAPLSSGFSWMEERAPASTKEVV